jgi:hypothetical protein
MMPTEVSGSTAELVRLEAVVRPEVLDRVVHALRDGGARPAPTISRNRQPSSIDRSVRASCIMLQKPERATDGSAKRQKPCPSRIGILVERIATTMLTIRGSVARRVSNPSRISVPPRTSTTPTNGPRTSGAGMPDLGEATRHEGRGVSLALRPNVRPRPLSVSSTVGEGGRGGPR